MHKCEDDMNKILEHYSYPVNKKDLLPQLFFFLVLFLLSLPALTNTTNQNPETIPTSDLSQFSAAPDRVKKLINEALALSNKNLGYHYASADPKNGGMDCSGTIYYLLNSLGIKEVPRSSDLIYQWVWKKGYFHAVNGNQINGFEFSRLQPGDLLFWSGTYEIKREINVTHVMIYLGTDKVGNHIMVGASNGRTYKGRKIYGVSVFDFILPPAGSTSRFLGYSCIPDINCKNRKH